MFRTLKRVDMGMNVTTKKMHDADLRALYKLYILIVDANKDIENYSTLECSSATHNATLRSFYKYDDPIVDMCSIKILDTMLSNVNMLPSTNI